MFEKLGKFFKEVKQEMRYVSWPTRDDLKEGTSVVIVMSAFVALFLSVVDYGFKVIMNFVIFN